jgi:hypothetical protein
MVAQPGHRTSTRLRLLFWILGIIIACFQSWAYRYEVSADSISYLDMSDGMMAGGDWHRLINGTWSPLYPFLLGLFRRCFSISPAHEIVAAHLLNVVIFLFAFACFEMYLTSLIRRMQWANAAQPMARAFPLPAYLAVAYALFLWSSLVAISLRFLRPDMLMSGFLYLAMGALLTFAERPARWRGYITLGIVLGVAFLAKAPMLPIGLLMLAVSLLQVQDWRPALKMLVVSVALIFLIGSLYFVPLSHLRGRFTLGESGPYNYLVNVDRAGSGEGWYLESTGHGSGKFLHPPQEIFESPRAYAFAQSSTVTHPLRFDPSAWTAGARPRFALKRQIGETLANTIDLVWPLRRLILLFAGLLVLLVFTLRADLLELLRKAWLVWLVGLAGCGMYLVVHVESRYVGAFLVLIFSVILYALLDAARTLDRKILGVATVLVVASLLVPAVLIPLKLYQTTGQGPNEDALAAAGLAQLGVAPGDHVARISSQLTDLGPERIARLEVACEVDHSQADQFWSAPSQVQNQILHLFISHGAKAVLATRSSMPTGGLDGWKRLTGKYWVWMP